MQETHEPAVLESMRFRRDRDSVQITASHTATPLGRAIVIQERKKQPGRVQIDFPDAFELRRGGGSRDRPALDLIRGNARTASIRPGSREWDLMDDRDVIQGNVRDASSWWRKLFLKDRRHVVRILERECSRLAVRQDRCDLDPDPALPAPWMRTIVAIGVLMIIDWKSLFK